MLKCPRTGTALTKIKVGGISVEFSKACGGVFFDNSELQHFNEKDSKRGEVLSAHLRQFIPQSLDLSQRVKCPKCPSVVMMRRFYSHKSKIELDECPSCGGFWFDYGELEQLRKLYPTKESRRKASREFEDDMLNSSYYQNYTNDLEAKEKLVRRRFRQLNSRSGWSDSFFDVCDGFDFEL